LHSPLPIASKLARPGLSGGRHQDIAAASNTFAPQSFLQTEVVPLLLSFGSVSLVTALLLLLEQTLAASLVPIAYLVPVIIAATRWGIWPATLASIASMAEADFFFFPPIFSFQVEDPLPPAPGDRNAAPARTGHSQSL
jgi:K+-sensing histidine kinase KdpD